MRGEDVVCNKGEATFLLAPGERLVVHGHTADAIVYDREQAAAVVKRQQIQDINKKPGVADVPLADPKAPGTQPLGTKPAGPKDEPPKTKEEAIAQAKKSGVANPEEVAKKSWPKLFETKPVVDVTKPASQPGTVQTGVVQKENLDTNKK